MTHPKLQKGTHDLYSPKEVAAVLGLEVEAIQQLVDNGKMSCRFVDHAMRFSRGDIAAYLSRQRKRTAGRDEGTNRGAGRGNSRGNPR